MNIPVDDNGMVHFKTCLFAMCREALGFYMKDVEHQTKGDQELYSLLKAYWPQHAKSRVVNLCLPQDEGQKNLEEED